MAVSRGLHRQHSDGDVIPSLVYKDRVALRRHRGSARHRGLPVRLHQPRSCGNFSRLTDYILVCDLFLSVTCITIAYVLGMGLICYEKFVFSAPNPNSGIRARLCGDVLYGYNTSSMCASILQLLPSRVYSFSVAAMFDEAAPDRPYAFT